MFNLKIDSNQTTKGIARALRSVAAWVETGTHRGNILDDRGQFIGNFGETTERPSGRAPKSGSRSTRKAPRSAAQKAATKRMIAANKRSR